MTFKRSLDVDKGTHPAKRRNGYRTKRKVKKEKYGGVAQLGAILTGMIPE